MTDRKNVSSNSKWEETVGYSRAVRVGPHVYVAGTTATDETGAIAAPGDPYGQSVYILEKIRKALAAAGAELSDVVRTRLYVKDIRAWREIARAHHEYFADVRPAATMIEVSSLVLPEMEVEIEVEAFRAREARGAPSGTGK